MTNSLSSEDIMNLSAINIAYNSALKTLLDGGNLFVNVICGVLSTINAQPHLLSFLDPSVKTLVCLAYLSSIKQLQSALNCSSV